MRVDKFLFLARLTKTRAQAQAIVAGGHLRIDGRALANTHGEIAPGNVITLPLHGTIRAIRVLSLPRRRGPAPEARAHYEELTTAQPIDAQARAL